jgi:sugar lactone lactonase YvrE
LRKLIPLLLLCSVAHATSTRTFRLTSYKDFEEGEATGVLLSSLGEASSGFGATRVDVGESVVYSSATGPDGTIYFGTGDQANLYAYKNGKAKKLTHLDGVLITSIAVGPGSTLYASVMPGGRIFSVDTRDGKWKELARLDVEHVWALVSDGKSTLYAGTGSQGKLFAVDTNSGKSRLLYDTGEKHLLSLARGDDGAIYAGSADQAILFKITPEGNSAKLRALHDFEGEEVRAIARRGNTLYVAVNEFQRNSAITTPSPTAPKGTKIVLPTGPGSTTPPPSTSSTRDRKGKGAVYRVDPDGRVEQLHALADGYFTALHVDNDGNVYAASGANGRVYLIRPDRTVITAFDLPERQVLTLAMSGGEKALGTGDAGAIYKLTNEPPKDANYLSKVFDAQFPSRWGNMRWTGAGALTVQTRSGNTSKPDKTWSAWQSPPKVERASDGQVGRVASPEARYLQVKVGFGSNKTTLRDLTIYYQPQNQRPRVTEITIGDEAKPRPTAAARTRPRSPIVKLKWKVENPDDDELVYRLYFREENEQNWKPLGGPEPITRTELDWNTEPIPDGNYVVKVVASDERANPKEETLEHALVSSPFLVDNRKPELLDVKVNGNVFSGRAQDSFSPISELAYSVDGGDWQPFSPKDGIFDDPVEDFSVKLPDKLAPGAHSLAVRAVDAADNVGAVQTTFRVK